MPRTDDPSGEGSFPRSVFSMAGEQALQVQEMTGLPPGKTGRKSAVPEPGARLAAGPQEAGAGGNGGMRPRRKAGDGGEAPGADVDLVDALPPRARRIVAAWLSERASPAARQSRLRVLAAFLRWLEATEPSLDALAVTGVQLDDYCEAALAGTLTVGVRRPGKPLARATVARKRAVLSSFYGFAWRNGAVRHSRSPRPAPAGDGRPAISTGDGPTATPVGDGRVVTSVGDGRATASAGVGRAAQDGRAVASGGAGHVSGPIGDGRVVSREERRRLRHGAARLAADGRPNEAAAVALLEATGATADALAGLTLQDLRAVTLGEPAIVTVHDGHGDLVAFPIPPLARPLLRTLSAARTAGEPLIRRADGRSMDARWLKSALADAALAGGIPPHRAELLDPHLLRAVTVAEIRRTT